MAQRVSSALLLFTRAVNLKVVISVSRQRYAVLSFCIVLYKSSVLQSHQHKPYKAQASLAYASLSKFLADF